MECSFSQIFLAYKEMHFGSVDTEATIAVLVQQGSFGKVFNRS